MPADTSDTSMRRQCRRLLVAVLVLLLGFDVPLRAAPRPLPSSGSTSVVGPWRYQSLWRTMRKGRGAVIGVENGECVAGKFVYGGPSSVEISTDQGLREIPVSSIRFVVNVVDLSHARDGAVVGGLIGLGTGVALSFATRDRSASATSSASRISRPLALNDSSDPDVDGGSSSGTTESESSSGDEYPSESTAGSDPEGGSSGSSTGEEDPTQTGSNTYEEDGGSSSGESSGSSSGGTATSPTTAQSSESSGNSNTVVYIGGQGGSSSSSPYGGTQQPSGGSSLSPAARTFFFGVGFAALGSFLGWMIGKRVRNSVPRVDYVLLAPGETESRGRTKDQFLADAMTSESAELPSESLLPGSSFDSERSAALFDQYAHAGKAVKLHPSLGVSLTDAEAREYRLFPAVRSFTQAMIVQYGGSQERQGVESRYFAVVTSNRGGAPLVSLQRLTARDVVRMSAQVHLIRAGILP